MLAAGIATGDVYVGSVGSEHRQEHAVVGDTGMHVVAVPWLGMFVLRWSDLDVCTACLLKCQRSACLPG